MLTSIATLIITLVMVLFPVLIPATITAFHALGQLRRRTTQSRAEHDRVGYVVESVPASI
jgi:hypothetical protein